MVAISVGCVRAIPSRSGRWASRARRRPKSSSASYDGIDKYTPDLVSWNGGGFDLPVLHYRALRHGIAAPRYWESGDGDQAFR